MKQDIIIFKTTWGKWLIADGCEDWSHYYLLIGQYYVNVCAEKFILINIKWNKPNNNIMLTIALCSFVEEVSATDTVYFNIN